MTGDALRTYWRGLIIAAAVSLRQLGDLAVSDRIRESPPYVLLQEQPESDGFSPSERIGRSVLTIPLESVGSYSKN
jgi:hypothetical protein